MVKLFWNLSYIYLLLDVLTSEEWLKAKLVEYWQSQLWRTHNSNSHKGNHINSNDKPPCEEERKNKGGEIPDKYFGVHNLCPHDSIRRTAKVYTQNIFWWYKQRGVWMYLNRSTPKSQNGSNPVYLVMIHYTHKYYQNAK